MAPIVSMADPQTNALTIESTLGLCASRGSRTIDVGAGAVDGLLAVADGIGGHCTGWLGARLAVRALVERLARPASEARFVGAANDFPDDWGWAGAMQSRAAAEHVYEACAADFGARSAFPRDLAAAFQEIDRVVAGVSEHGRIHGLVVACLAATIEGARVCGAHAGIGRALLLRAGTLELESLVVEHYMHLVLARMPNVPDIDPAQLPPNIIASALGAAPGSGVGVDRFDIELTTGDLLLLCSRRLDLPDEELARLARETMDAGSSLGELARTIERRSAAVPEGHSPRDVAFALALAR